MHLWLTAWGSPLSTRTTGIAHVVTAPSPAPPGQRASSPHHRDLCQGQSGSLSPTDIYRKGKKCKRKKSVPSTRALGTPSLPGRWVGGSLQIKHLLLGTGLGSPGCAPTTERELLLLQSCTTTGGLKTRRWFPGLTVPALLFWNSG